MLMNYLPSTILKKKIDKMILKLIQHLWNGILLICGIFGIALCGKFAYEFFSTPQSFFNFCIGIIAGTFMLGCLVMIGWLLFSIINPNNKNSFPDNF